MYFDESIRNMIIDRSVPGFVQEQYPLFVAFLNAYYEWMEEYKNPTDIILNLRDYRDIDRTVDEFLEYFKSELLEGFPSDIPVDPRLLAKIIKEFYISKGTEQSYKFLFRLLFNEEIDLYFPRDDVLRASDGKWVEPRSVKIALDDSIDFQTIQNKQIIGTTSGATAIVESVLRYQDRGEVIAELFLSQITGTFLKGEFIDIVYSEGNISVQLLELFVAVDVTFGGSGYSVGDMISIRNYLDEEITKATISAVTTGPVTGITLIAGGQDYVGNINFLNEFGKLPGNWTLNGDYLPDTPVEAQDSNATDYSEYTFETIIPTQEIEGTGDIIVISDGSSGVGFGAFGQVEVVDTQGTIVDISLQSGGANYSQPSARVNSSTGTGAEIEVIGGGGSVSEVTIGDFKRVLPEDIDTAYPDFTDKGNGDATGTMVIDSLAKYQGQYLNDDGHLSSTKRLQDNRYYQDFSYVIRTGMNISEWEETIKRLIHPAGFALFGSTYITLNIPTVKVSLKGYISNKF